jgi:hypothetical protein
MRFLAALALSRTLYATWPSCRLTSLSRTAETAPTCGEAVGYSFGKPVIVKTAAKGWVVLVASGYNNGGDGKGYLFVLDAKTGAVIKGHRHRRREPRQPERPGAHQCLCRKCASRPHHRFRLRRRLAWQCMALRPGDGEVRAAGATDRDAE